MSLMVRRQVLNISLFQPPANGCVVRDRDYEITPDHFLERNFAEKARRRRMIAIEAENIYPAAGKTLKGMAAVCGSMQTNRVSRAF